MEVNELRIGNKLQKDNGGIFTVIRIGATQDVLVLEERGLLTLDYNLFGIPLTPEILEKCGFEWEDIETHTDKTTRGLYKGILMMLPLPSNKGWYAALFGYPLSLYRTQYLHQLQNLYFALTGEELVFNKQ